MNKYSSFVDVLIIHTRQKDNFFIHLLTPVLYNVVLESTVSEYLFLNSTLRFYGVIVASLYQETERLMN